MTRRLSLSLLLIAGACTVQRSTPSAPGLARSSQRPGSVTAPATSSSGMSADEHMAHMSAADMAAPSVNTTTPLQSAALPPSNNGAPERLKSSPRHGEWVKIAYTPGSADSLMAWVVYPFAKDSRQKAPVVVVVHEIFGLSPWVRGVADQVAAEGFIAIAPDFLSRVRGGPTSIDINPDSARRLIAGVNIAERNTIITAAANYAMMLPSAKQKYAVMGYCWGGTTTWAHAVNGGVKGFSGGVPYYGAPYTKAGTPATATTAAVPASVDADSLMRIKQPILMLNGTKDARIGALMPAIDSVMRARKKKYEGVNYEGAVHGFLRAQNDVRATASDSAAAIAAAEATANLAATKDAWPRTVAFLKKRLGVK